MNGPESLEAVDRTWVRWRGRTLTYFGGCDYFRLSSHPRMLRAVRDGLEQFGLSVSASRLTTGNHALYAKLEKDLARFFDAETALVVNSGYVTNLIAAQALAGQFSHALLDEHAHAALRDAAEVLGCPILRYRHRDPENLAQTLHRFGQKIKPVVLTDGMFAHDGSTAPLAAYLNLLPRDGLLLVDDAHGAGTLGKAGKGTVELEGVSRQRVVQCVTLSKAFGVYGGAVLCSKALRKRMISQSRIFAGSTPLPLPLAYAAREAIRLFRSDTTLRRRLGINVSTLKSSLRASGLHLPETPGPIVSIQPTNSRQVARLKHDLLAAGILPPFISYPGSPLKNHFRFVISSEHSPRQIALLNQVLLHADL